ncbi:MAG TPA: DUF72 domain-containing protein [Terriglobia bacterium]|nr:DUF72 domain-containing protein [Terriglobia bacterium]
MAKLYAGTSGFAYPSWKPRFYPSDVPAKRFLEYYSRRLNSVEINYTFRRLAASTTLENWIKATEPGFLFVTKAHERITHLLRLKDAAEFTDLFLRSIDPLRATRRLGPILFQLPPYLRCDVSVLRDFLIRLPRDLRYTFEFRNASWLDDAVYDLLRQHNAALCWAESEKIEIPEVATADFAYFRLRKEEYSPAERKKIAAAVKKVLTEGKDVFVFFKHEETPEGALYAEELLKAVASDKGRVERGGAPLSES